MKEIKMQYFENDVNAANGFYPIDEEGKYRFHGFVDGCPQTKATLGADWFILRNGRVCLAVGGPTSGGRIMDGFEIRQEPPILKPAVAIAEGHKSSRVFHSREIPVGGKVIVSKGNQRFEFSYSEK